MPKPKSYSGAGIQNVARRSQSRKNSSINQIENKKPTANGFILRPLDNSRVNDNRILNNHDSDDFTPNVLVLLDKLPEDYLITKCKRSSAKSIAQSYRGCQETSFEDIHVPSNNSVVSQSESETISLAVLKKNINKRIATVLIERLKQNDTSKVVNSKIFSRDEVERPKLGPASLIIIDDDDNENGNSTNSRQSLDQGQGPLPAETLEQLQPVSQPILENIVEANSTSILNQEREHKQEIIDVSVVSDSDGPNKKACSTTFIKPTSQANNTGKRIVSSSKRKTTIKNTPRSKKSENSTKNTGASPVYSYTGQNENEIFTPAPALTMSTSTLDIAENKSGSKNANGVKLPKPIFIGKSKKYECSVCHDKFRLHLDLTEHLIMKHSVICMVYRCMICDFSFSKKELFILHMEEHCDGSSSTLRPSSKGSQLASSNIAVEIESHAEDFELIDLVEVDDDEVDDGDEIEDHEIIRIPIQGQDQIQLLQNTVEESKSENISQAQTSMLESLTYNQICTRSRQTQQHQQIQKTSDANKHISSDIALNVMKEMSHISTPPEYVVGAVVVEHTNSMSTSSSSKRKYSQVDPHSIDANFLSSNPDQNPAYITFPSRMSGLQKRYNIRQRSDCINYRECQICSKCKLDFLTAEELDDHFKRCGSDNTSNVLRLNKCKIKRSLK